MVSLSFIRKFIVTSLEFPSISSVALAFKESVLNFSCLLLSRVSASALVLSTLVSAFGGATTISFFGLQAETKLSP
ncbi:hypothetical protein [Pedobacter jamesrossensis]|uniref:hypothetical protein n=1 Tax=Pedobacter jamesrossensis TaxID=1908238 RepID=UPI00361DD5BD